MKTSPPAAKQKKKIVRQVFTSAHLKYLTDKLQTFF